MKQLKKLDLCSELSSFFGNATDSCSCRVLMRIFALQELMFVRLLYTKSRTQITQRVSNNNETPNKQETNKSKKNNNGNCNGNDTIDVLFFFIFLIRKFLSSYSFRFLHFCEHRTYRKQLTKYLVWFGLEGLCFFSCFLCLMQ